MTAYCFKFNETHQRDLNATNANRSAACIRSPDQLTVSNNSLKTSLFSRPNCTNQFSPSSPTLKFNNIRQCFSQCLSSWTRTINRECRLKQVIWHEPKIWSEAVSRFKSPSAISNSVKKLIASLKETIYSYYVILLIFQRFKFSTLIFSLLVFDWWVLIEWNAFGIKCICKQ